MSHMEILRVFEVPSDSPQNNAGLLGRDVLIEMEPSQTIDPPTPLRGIGDFRESGTLLPTQLRRNDKVCTGDFLRADRSWVRKRIEQ